MLTFWNNAKLGLKMQAAFGLVMLVFVGAIVGILAVNQKVAALNQVQNGQVVPAKVAILKTALAFRTADDAGGYDTMDQRSAPMALELATYNKALDDFSAAFKDATNLATDDTAAGRDRQYPKIHVRPVSGRIRSRERRLVQSETRRPISTIDRRLRLQAQLSRSPTKSNR